MSNAVIGALRVNLSANSAQFETGMKRVGEDLRKFQREAQNTNTKVGGALSGLSRMVPKGLLAGVFAGITVGQVSQYAEAFVRVQNALKVAGLQGEALTSTYRALFDIAQRQGAPIEALSTLYGRAAQVQGELNASSAEMLRFTEGVATALRVQGTSAQESAGALLQLSQLLGSGTVRAEEFNSVNEGARPILQAVAAGLKEAGGSVSTLRSLVIDGKVSSEAFFRAFLAGSKVVEDQASKTETTVSQAFVRMRNSFIDLIGRLNEMSGASKGAAAGLELVASTLDAIGRNLPRTLQGVAKATAQIADLENQMAQARAMGQRAIADDLGKQIEAARRTKDDVAQATAEMNRARGMTTGGPARPAVVDNPVSLADFPVAGAKAGGRGGGGGSGRSAADAFAEDMARSRQRTEALRLELQTLNLSTVERERARVAQELENEAIRAKLAVTPELRAQIDEVAMAQATATARLEEARAAQEDFLALQKFVGSSLSSFFSDIVSGGENAEKALMNLVKRMTDAALQALLLGEGPLGKFFGGGRGVIGAVFGAATGSLGAPLQLAGAIGRNAQGTGNWRGGMTWVGERGPELVNLPRGAQVIPNHEIGGAGGSVVFAPNIDARGADPGQIALLRAEMRQQAASMAKVVDGRSRTADLRRVRA